MSGHQVTLSSVLWFGRIHKEGCALECEDTNLSKVSLYFSFPFYVYHFFSSFELAFVDVYTNDISSSSLFGCLNHGQTKCTEAKNRNGLLRLHLRRIENGTPPSGNSAAFFLWKWKVLNKILNQLNYQLKSFLPKRHILFKSAPGWILAADISAMTAYSANVEHP